MTIEALIARGFQLLLAMTGAYTLALWFALIVWTFRDIETRSRSVIAQIFSTLVVVLFFLPGGLLYLLLRPKETLDEVFGRALEEEYLLQDLEDLSLCPTCHHPVREDYVACPHCFTELRHTCPSCNRLAEVSWSICAYCTAELVTTPPQEIEVVAPREERPSLLPLPLRILRERTEERLDHLLTHEEAARLPEGQAATPPNGSLIARETQAAGAWTDDSGKGSWFLTRAREVFAPLTGTEPPHTNGHAPTNGTAPEATNGADPVAKMWADTQEGAAAFPPPPPPIGWPQAAAPNGDDPTPTAVPVTKESPAPPTRELYAYRPARSVAKRPNPPPEDGAG